MTLMITNKNRCVYYFTWFQISAEIGYTPVTLVPGGIDMLGAGAPAAEAVSGVLGSDGAGGSVSAGWLSSRS